MDLAQNCPWLSRLNVTLASWRLLRASAYGPTNNLRSACRRFSLVWDARSLGTGKPDDSDNRKSPCLAEKPEAVASEEWRHTSESTRSQHSETQAARQEEVSQALKAKAVDCS